MRRTYEMALVVDPRLTDEEAVEVVDLYRQMVLDSGAVVTKEESWGKRKLAYAIKKLREGYYTFLYIVAEDVSVPFREIEFRLGQNESVLRYLIVRTDEDLQRAVRKGKPFVPAAAAVGVGPAQPPEPPEAPEAPVVEAGS